MIQLDSRAPEVASVVDIPFPKIDFARVANPIPFICESTEFLLVKEFFATSPSATRSLLSDAAQALLYCVIRNARPDHMVEIGTYRAGTTEGLARALHANGTGILHTVSPFDAERVNAIMPYWPEELRRHVRYHQMDSMAFFMQIDVEHIRPDGVLIDGHHDYEFASFDLQASARRLKAGGFLFIDNVSQAGPYFACRDFVTSHPDWIDCGIEERPPSDIKAFDDNRSKIPMTDLCVLRSPPFYVVGSRPVTFGEMYWSDKAVSGLRLSLQGRKDAGTLRVQCVLRAFSETRIVELVTEATAPINHVTGQIDIPFQKPLMIDGEFDHYKIEPWLTWLGPISLALSALPVPY
jgi:predicted O-methyltransferase YrrM